MNTTSPALFFPRTLRKLRRGRGRLQKTLAIQIGVDATVLSGIETGARAPLDVDNIQKAVVTLQLSESEEAELLWAAHHDRLVTGLEQRGGTALEREFLSSGLRAIRHLEPRQIKGLIRNLGEVERSARLITTLSTTFQFTEVIP
jgi:transcriptional regulator with XRE-family HTH domain